MKTRGSGKGIPVGRDRPCRNGKEVNVVRERAGRVVSTEMQEREKHQVMQRLLDCGN